MDPSEMLAHAIIAAGDIREASYDKDAADKAGQEAEEKNREGNNGPYCIPDYSKFYKLTQEEAADKACELVGYDTQMTQPVFLLIYLAWNDSRAWALEVLNPTCDKTPADLSKDLVEKY